MAAAALTALTALLEYQTFPRLSTAFYKFFSFFEYLLFAPLISVRPLGKIENALGKRSRPGYNAFYRDSYTQE